MLKSACSDTAKSIERNNMMSFASVISVVAALLILGVFIVITINVESVTKNVVSSLELKVFLTNTTTQEELTKLEQDMTNDPDITGFVFESKDEALQKYSTKLDKYSGLLNGFTAANNPISDSYTVSVTNPSQLNSVKSYIQGLKSDAVDYVKYGEEYVDVLMNFSEFMNYACITVLVILSVISVVIIYNTIKLTCHSRRKEIAIMKVVGADDWYVRLPFFFEGMGLGILGAIIAFLLIRMGYMYMIGMSNTLAYLPMNSKLVAPDQVLPLIMLFSLIYGIIIGAFGSLFSIRKYLDA